MDGSPGDMGEERSEHDQSEEDQRAFDGAGRRAIGHEYGRDYRYSASEIGRGYDVQPIERAWQPEQYQCGEPGRQYRDRKQNGDERNHNQRSRKRASSTVPGSVMKASVSARSMDDA